LASPRPRGREGLTRAGRADEQHAAGDAAAEALELLRIAQEFHDLLQVLLGLVDARHVLEGHAAMGLREELRLRLAEAHGAAGAALHLAREEHPGADEEREGQDVHEKRDEPGVLSESGRAVICTPFCWSFVTSMGSFGA
jgi:hypothetical protein